MLTPKAPYGVIDLKRSNPAAHLGSQMFQVINYRTGAIVGTYSTKQRARNAVDRKDNAYGGYVHSVREVAL